LPERLHFVSGLEFNLSHSENRLLIAVSRNRSVGVDIEKPICPPAFRKIAARFFAASENELLLRAKDVCESEDLFLRIWTCREALIKAMGNTLFSHQASVHWARTNEGGGLESSSPQWKIQELRLKKDFFAALAVRAS
jgi:4'-phosphopantetheinyl transferase